MGQVLRWGLPGRTDPLARLRLPHRRHQRRQALRSGLGLRSGQATLVSQVDLECRRHFGPPVPARRPDRRPVLEAAPPVWRPVGGLASPAAGPRWPRPAAAPTATTRPTPPISGRAGAPRRSRRTTCVRWCAGHPLRHRVPPAAVERSAHRPRRSRLLGLCCATSVSAVICAAVCVGGFSACSDADLAASSRSRGDVRRATTTMPASPVTAVMRPAMAAMRPEIPLSTRPPAAVSGVDCHGSAPMPLRTRWTSRPVRP